MTPGSGGLSRLRNVLPLALIIAVAVAVRVYRLDEQSVWWDDYNGLVGLRAPDLGTCLRMALGVNPEAVPFYFTVQHFASLVLGTTPVMMRLFSVLLGVLTLPVVYLIGRDLFGRKAGLIAALCFALSPIHVFHDQSIRLYPLLVLLATCSLYTLLRATRTRRSGWWALNLILNTLIVWTHLLSVFVVFTEGLFLLLTMRGRVRRTLAWAGLQALLLIPSAVYVHYMAHVPGVAYEHFHAPTARKVFYDVVGDDAIGTGYDLSFSADTWGFVPGAWAQKMLQQRPRVDTAFVILFCVSLGWLLWRMGRTAWSGRRGRTPRPRDPSARVAFDGVLLLLLWATVPVLALSALSHLWRPCIYPRYTMYTTVALYAACGGAVQGLRFRALQAVAVGAIGALYAFQLSFTLPTATRTDWIGVGRHITSRATPDDLILVGSRGASYPNIGVFCFNLGSSALPIAPAHTLQAVCDKSVCFFARHRTDLEPRPSVWFLINRLFSWISLENLNECLKARGLEFEERLFPALEQITLYRIQAGPEFDPEKAKDATPVTVDYDYHQMLAALGLDYADPAQERAAIDALRRAYDDGYLDPSAPMLNQVAPWLLEDGDCDMVVDAARKAIETHPDDPTGYTLLSSALLIQGHTDAAIEAARAAVDRGPISSDTHLALALALYNKGNAQEAEEIFRKAVQYGGGVERFEGLVTALIRGDRETGRAEAFRLRTWNIMIPPIILMDLGLNSWLTSCPPVGR